MSNHSPDLAHRIDKRAVATIRGGLLESQVILVQSAPNSQQFDFALHISRIIIYSCSNTFMNPFCIGPNLFSILIKNVMR